MPIVRHSKTGKVTPYATTVGYTVQDVVDHCTSDEVSADLSRRQTPYDEILAKLRKDDTHGTDD